MEALPFEAREEAFFGGIVVSRPGDFTPSLSQNRT